LPGIHTAASTLDRDPWTLVCPNGVVDLRTGALHEHSREALNTKSTAVPYDPHAKAPRFEQFLHEIFPSEPELAPYVIRYLGYALTGSTQEQVFQVWYGEGANGKSTLIETLVHVLGDYAQTMASDLLLERRGARDSGAASPDVARLRGVRLAAGVETKEGQRWNESLVKQLTGGDQIVARHLYKEPIEFHTAAKLVLGVNHKPNVHGTDHGMWRRVALVSFKARFDGTNADHSLTDKLRAEASGILTMLVSACLEWQRIGLAPPQCVIDDVRAYREGQDVLGQFLRECCYESAGYANKASLYRAFSMWARDSNEYVLGKHTFNNRMRGRGWTEARRDGGPAWLGIEINRPGVVK
jgi:putative DNA primase/helicase